MKQSRKSSIYKIVISGIAVSVLLVHFIFNEYLVSHLIIQILPAFIFIPFGIESYRNKKWLPFSAYTILSILIVLSFMQELYRQIFIY
ncbi:hypothetical protein [Leuconostoc suionicum]|uniref:hypothetical protein n=1 Tax=Leuconostoc suionicum TaxID=1511761 RepID=UPI0024ACE638|nr:hypothetical protein [Leuconostoc suionicum]MDI6522876.1 hypothetical protein [Leuconostoc suionicum]